MALNGLVTEYQWALVCVSVAIAATGFHNCGITVNPQDLAPKHSGSVFGLMNTIGAVPGWTLLCLTVQSALLSLSSALAQAAPPTLSTAWTTSQSLFSKTSVTISPLYSAPMRTALSIGSCDGHCISRLYAPMGSPSISHWTRPGSSGGYLTRWFLERAIFPPSPNLPPRLVLPGLPHIPLRLTLPEHPSVPPLLTLPEHPHVPLRLTLPEHSCRPFYHTPSHTCLNKTSPTHQPVTPEAEGRDNGSYV
ncbi:unnamed protein product, partial [Timema podura]|nr:unnamed protein product [Timema podura]